MFLVKSGKYVITKNGKTIEVGAGEIAVFDSYDVHSYDKKLEEQNDLLEKGAEVTEKQAQAFNAQSNALDNSFNVVKKGLSNVERGFKGLYAIGKDFVKFNLAYR